LPVSAGVYLLACRSIDLEQDRATAAAADFGLEPCGGPKGVPAGTRAAPAIDAPAQG